MNDEKSFSEKPSESSVMDVNALDGVNHSEFKKKILQNVSSLIELLDIMSEEELFNHYGEMTFLKQALTAIETLDCPEKREIKLNRIEERISSLKNSISDNSDLQIEENSNNRRK